MSDAPGEQQVPRSALLAAAGVIAVAIVLAGAARVSDIGTTHMPESSVVTSLDLRFMDRDDGAVVIYSAADGHLVDVLPHGTNGFARGVLRGLARDRRRSEIGAQQPFRLVRFADGRLSLDDPATGRRIDLDAFGPTNVAVFARLMTQDGKSPAAN
jgi:putative photosynthetic complex assembly protein